MGGILLFSLIGSWVFGREFTDGTLRDLLAVPVRRASILLAKFSVVAAWSLALTVLIYLAGLGLGALVGLPPASTAVFLQGAASLAITACLVTLAVSPAAFFASLGRGYLLPLGSAMLMLLLAQIVAFVGWGNYFPWSVPALYAGLTGSQGAGLTPASYWIVIFTGLAGMGGTYLWWRYADQSG